MLSATSFIFPLTFLLPTSPFIHSPPNFPLLANITLTQAGDPEITLDSTISCLSYRFSFLFGLPSWVCLFPDPLSGHSFFLLLARSDYKASLPVFTHHGSSYSVQAGDPEITLDSTISWFNYCFFFFFPPWSPILSLSVAWPTFWSIIFPYFGKVLLQGTSTCSHKPWQFPSAWPTTLHCKPSTCLSSTISFLFPQHSRFCQGGTSHHFPSWVGLLIILFRYVSFILVWTSLVYPSPLLHKPQSSQDIYCLRHPMLFEASS